MGSIDKIKFAEINYHYHREFTEPGDAIALHSPSNMFAVAMLEEADITLVKHINFEGHMNNEGVDYAFFKGKNKFFHIPTRTHRFVKDLNPDLVLVQGLIFPFQVITLRRTLGPHCRIILQHHGERPHQKKRIFQRMADRNVDGYIFSSMGNTTEWIKAGVIRDSGKCFEINPSTTSFSRRDKSVSREITGMNGDTNFLWVGRLNENKDPVTVLKGFERHLHMSPSHHLYMIYGDEEGLDPVQSLIESSAYLKDNVHLIGKVPNKELENWYNAADYFISGSHREGGSYALTEAMACGCIPIVTEIPPAMRAIDSGRVGLHYKAGDIDSLHSVLKKLHNGNRSEMSRNVERQFNEQMSASAIAAKMMEVYRHLNVGKRSLNETVQ